MKKALIFICGSMVVAAVAPMALGHESDASLERKAKQGDRSARDTLYNRQLWRELRTRREEERLAVRTEQWFGIPRELV